MSSEPFLHLKFTSQRPPPQYGHQLPFAHLVDPTVHELPDSLKTDVQREGIQRYLVQNFKEGSFVWEVVKERVSPNLDERREEEDPEVKDSDGMYIVVNRSWARTVGDSKLHLSLYVYQEDKHCATWHAYTDRTISYSRESESTPADAPAEPSDQEQADEQERDGDEEEEADPEPDEAAIPNEDPYSPPSALAQYVASMESRPSSPFEPPERDSERPRFDRPYKEPVADPADVEERVEKEEIKSPVEHGRNTRRKEKTKATSVEVKSRGRSDDEEKEKEEEKARGDRSRDSTRKGRKLAIESDPEEEERSKKDKVKARSGRETSEEEEEEDRRQSTPHIVKSQPIGHRSARKKDRDEEKEEDSRSRSRSPSPVKTRSSRSKKREPSPEPSSDSEARSRSPRSPSHEKDAPSPIPVAKPERGRKPGRAEKEKPPPASPSQSPSRSPSPRPKALSSRSKPATPPLAQDSRSPSPPRPKSRTSRRESVRPPSRSLSPVRDSRKTRTKGDTRVKSVEERSVEKVKERVRQLSGSRSRSRSRSRSPPRSRSPSPSPRSNRRATSRARGPEKDQERIEKVDRARGRSISRSPSPPEIPATRSSRRGKSSPPRRSSPSPPPAPRVAERSHGRRHSVAATTSRPKPAPRIPRAASPKTEQPTWRSVSRNRHRRSDDSDEDTLVRGNMDDDALDIPAGGETTLLKAKPIKHRQSHSKRDEGFDPDEVARARRTAEREKGRGGEREEPQTLKTAVGGWFKSVGTFIAPEAKLAVGTAEGEVHKAEAAVEHWEEAEREEKRKRKAERARRREERRQRREAEEVEKRKKEEELERMVDRAEDAAEDMLETSERLASRKEREAKRDTNKERRSRDTDHGGSGSEDEVSSRRPRHKHKEETTSVQSRSKHRASRPLSPEPEEEKRHSRSRDHRRHEKPSPTHESRSQRHRGEVSDQSDSDHREEEKEAKASARPALRQRAMSISASVDAGLRGLRESVSKIVSDARQVDTEQDEKDRDRERRRAERERRKIDKERKAIEEERRQLEQEAEQVGRSKRRRAERDRKEREDIRLAERAREPRREDVEDFEGKSSRPRRQRHGRSRPSSPSPLRVSPETVASESERPSSQSRRSDRREPPSSDDESTARKKPLVSSRNTPSSARRLDNDDSRAADPSPRRRHGQEPPRRSRADSVISDTDMSEAPSRSSRSVRSMDRSESEADTPAHIEAKRNARRNSTTIPIEQIRTLREQQLEAGTRSIPASPVTSKSRHDLPQRERASTRAEMPRSARDDSSDGDSLDVDTSRRPKPALAPPAAPAYPRRLSPAPVVASPVSSYGAYSPTDPPLRPRPVKPSSYRAPPPRTPSEQPRSETLAARFYTPASSGDSSDEADPSRPPSVRTRRGYSSGGSVASERRASHGERGDLRSPAASYRLPRSDSEPEEPPLRRIESFSRTHPSSYPFTTDDEGDYSEPALTTTRLRRGIEAEASSRSTKPHSKNDRFDSAAFEDSEPEAYGRTGSSSAHPRHSYRRDNEDDDRSGVLHGATTKRSSQGREGGGGRRTMVSKPASTNPSSSSVSRTIPGMFNHRERPPIVETRHEDDDDDDEPTGYSTFSRSTTVDPYYSARSDPHDYGYGHRVVDPIIPPSFTPDLENGSSSPPPVRGFTGFDLRHHHSRQLEPSTSSNDGQGRRRGTDGKTGSGKKGLVGRSSVPFGANQAPVGRRMAQRLGVE